MRDLERKAEDGFRGVAVYSASYLNLSETFIQRQLLGVAPDWRPLMLTNEVRNPGFLKGEEIHEVPRTIIHRAMMRACRDLSRNYTWIPESLKRQYLRVLDAKGIALIHAHFAPAGFEMAPVAAELKVPLVVTFHGWDASSLIRSPAARDAIVRLSNAAHFICVSEAVKRKLQSIGVPSQRLQVHYIGVPLKEFSVSGAASGQQLLSNPHFLHVGRLVEKKGVNFTLKAFAKLLAELPTAKLTIVGDGELRQSLETLARDLGIFERVKFTGGLPNKEVKVLMKDCDVFVLHSVTAQDGDEEGLPIVLMEAMALAKPVVSTIHSGIPELIQDGQNGYLVAERDSERFSRAMLDALASREVLGPAARRTVEQHFNADVQNEKLSALYAQQVRGKPDKKL